MRKQSWNKINHQHLMAIVFLIVSSFVSAGDDLEKQRELFVKAENALRKDRFSEFERIRERLGDYPLNSYLQYMRLGKTPLQAKDIRQFLGKYPDSRFTPPLRRKLLTHLAAERNWQEYISAYQPTGNVRLQCFYYRALLRIGNLEKAFAGTKALWLVGHSQPNQCDPLFAAWRNRGKLNKALVWQRLEMAIDRGNLRLAGYLKRFLPISERVTADLWLDVHRNPTLLTNCSFLKKHGELNAVIFIHGIKRLVYQDSSLARQIWEARNHEFQITPNKRKNIQRRLALGLAVDRNSRALEYLESIDSQATDEKVLAWTARTALFRMRWKQALKALDSLTDSQKSEPRWNYWRARVLDELGEKQVANALFQDLTKERDFYGFMAADRLTQSYEFSPRSVDVSDSALHAMEDQLPFRASYEFLHFERETEARREWWHAIKQFDRRQLMAAAKIAQKWGWNSIGILTVARARHWDDLELRFPLAFNDPVIKYASTHDLDPAFVFALIRRESAFDKQAVSPAGARGLMQLMPATGRKVALSLGHRWNSVDKLHDPETNLNYGTAYFKSMLDKFDRNFVLAAAAYNAGPHRVLRWLPKENSVPADIWIENIPFQETRRYVSAVLAYSVIYQKRLKRNPKRLASFMQRISPGEGARNSKDAALHVAKCKSSAL